MYRERQNGHCAVSLFVHSPGHTWNQTNDWISLVSYKITGPDMASNVVTIRKNFGVFVHPCPPVEAMVCLESITARTSLSNWLVIDGSIPPNTLNTAQCRYTKIHKCIILKYTITSIQIHVSLKLACYWWLHTPHCTTSTLNAAQISFHTLCIALHTAHCECT